MVISGWENAEIYVFEGADHDSEPSFDESELSYDDSEVSFDGSELSFANSELSFDDSELSFEDSEVSFDDSDLSFDAQSIRYVWSRNEIAKKTLDLDPKNLHVRVSSVAEFEFCIFEFA